jgi:uncharacterized DUF497 family protein
MPEFEFDPLKSLQNLRKHGIALADVISWWDDPNRRIAQVKTVKGEIRHVLFTHIQNRLWAVVFTFRREKIRPISARPASRKERARYYHG